MADFFLSEPGSLFAEWIHSRGFLYFNARDHIRYCVGYDARILSHHAAEHYVADLLRKISCVSKSARLALIHVWRVQAFTWSRGGRSSLPGI